MRFRRTRKQDVRAAEILTMLPKYGKASNKQRWYCQFHTVQHRFIKLSAVSGATSSISFFFFASIIILVKHWWLLVSAPIHPRPKIALPSTYEEKVHHAKSLGKTAYEPIDRKNASTYDIFDCPLKPPSGYPREYPIMSVLTNWPVLDTDTNMAKRQIHSGICVFDFAKEKSNALLQAQILAYREAEVPFVVRNDPTVLDTVYRWNQDGYMKYRMQEKMFKADVSDSKSMMYWKVTDHHDVPQDWVPPTKPRFMTFDQWHDMAVAAENDEIGLDQKYKEYAYLRVDACLSKDSSCDAVYRNQLGGVLRRGFVPKLSDADFLFEEMPFFDPRKPEYSRNYLVDPTRQRGIQCRMGAKGLIAEDHFDNERNLITVLGGERRYLLGHPSNCKDMSLFPQDHPLERHTKVDWTKPNLEKFPNFTNVEINEVVLQPGDMLYLPTYWFHHIVSLSLNYQCNTRSGHSLEYDDIIDECGFLYLFPE